MPVGVSKAGKRCFASSLILNFQLQLLPTSAFVSMSWSFVISYAVKSPPRHLMVISKTETEIPLKVRIAISDNFTLLKSRLSLIQSLDSLYKSSSPMINIVSRLSITVRPRLPPIQLWPSGKKLHNKWHTRAWLRFQLSLAHAPILVSFICKAECLSYGVPSSLVFRVFTFWVVSYNIWNLNAVNRLLGERASYEWEEKNVLQTRSLWRFWILPRNVVRIRRVFCFCVVRRVDWLCRSWLGFERVLFGDFMLVGRMEFKPCFLCMRSNLIDCSTEKFEFQLYGLGHTFLWCFQKSINDNERNYAHCYQPNNKPQERWWRALPAGCPLVLMLVHRQHQDVVATGLFWLWDVNDSSKDVKKLYI